MTVRIKAVEMDDYNQCDIPDTITVTFTNGAKVAYRKSAESSTGITSPKIKLLEFKQPQFDLGDVKVNEKTFEALSKAYEEQLCILNTQHQSAFEEAERLYTKEKIDLDDFYKSQEATIESLRNTLTQEMSRRYQSVKKMADDNMKALKDPAHRIEVMLSWLQESNKKSLLIASKMVGSNAQYIINRMKSPEPKWHSFLSHVQRDSADVARNIRDTLLRKGMRMWYDKNMARLDCVGMIDGIIDSSMFTIILTKDYFSREYSIFEYCVAVVTGKPVMAVYEVDPRHGGGPLGSFQIPGQFEHLMKHELIDINRNYWEAFISKLENRIQSTLTSAQKMLLGSANSHAEEVKSLELPRGTGSIMNEREFCWLSGKLYDENRTWGARIFSSSNDGNTVKAFREKCDLKGATITLIETIDGKVFGGFTSRPWDGQKNWGVYSAKSAWLFTLRGGPMKKIQIKEEHYFRAVSDGKTETFGVVYGPIFGNVNNKHDLSVSPGMDFGGDVGFCEGPVSYSMDFEGDACFCEGPASYSSGIMAGQNKEHFKIKEWEVFQIENCPKVN